VARHPKVYHEIPKFRHDLSAFQTSLGGKRFRETNGINLSRLNFFFDQKQTFYENLLKFRLNLNKSSYLTKFAACSTSSPIEIHTPSLDEVVLLQQSQTIK